MINKLVENIKKTKAPIVVGLDPMLNYDSGAGAEKKSVCRIWRDIGRRCGGNLAVQ